jgi:hypothetical protein
MTTAHQRRVVSRPGTALAILVGVASVVLAVLIFRDISNEPIGSYWAPVAALFMLIYGAVAASVVVIGDVLIRWLIDKVRRVRAG